MRPVFDWNIGKRVLKLGKRTLVMGIVNVTPDSFSDGGKYLDPAAAIEHAVRLLEDGADIIDVGGESTRPGARVLDAGATEKSSGIAESLRPGVSETDEIERIIPVISGLKQQRPSATISVDTYKATVARAALGAGAEIVNDVSGLRWDAGMARTVAELKCGVVMMHSRGRPEEWRTLPRIADMLGLIKRELRQWADAALDLGVKRERLVLDPGFGFGKSFEENYPLMKHFEDFHQLRYPLLAGVSRKSFLGRLQARDGKDAAVDERAFATLAAETALALKGAHIIRTHDVRACRDTMRVADLIVG